MIKSLVEFTTGEEEVEMLDLRGVDDEAAAGVLYDRTAKVRRAGRAPNGRMKGIQEVHPELVIQLPSECKRRERGKKKYRWV